MGDENIVNTGTDDGGNADGAENADESQNDGDQGDGDGAEENNEGDDGAGDGDGGEKGQDKDKSKNEAPEDDDSEPDVRKTPTDFYKQRKARRAAAKGDQGASKKNNDDDSGDDDSDEDVDPEDAALIDSRVDKRIKPLIDQITTQADRDEANAFFSEHPEFKPYEAKITRWWQHESRRHLPIKTVAMEAVGFDNLVKMGAQRKQGAVDKAKKLNSGGGAPASNTGKKSVNEMTNEEFEAEKQRVLSQRGQ